MWLLLDHLCVCAHTFVPTEIKNVVLHAGVRVCPCCMSLLSHVQNQSMIKMMGGQSILIIGGFLTILIKSEK